jgi:hypothetical protein
MSTFIAHSMVERILFTVYADKANPNDGRDHCIDVLVSVSGRSSEYATRLHPLVR